MFKKKTDIEKLFSAINWNRINKVNELTDKIDNFTHQNEEGYNALMFALDSLHFDGYINIFASEEKRTATVEKLIEKTTDFSQQTKKGNTSLMIAIDNYQYDLADKICDKTDDVSQQNLNSDTALILSLQKGNPALSKKIINKTIDFSQQNERGQNALMLAIHKASMTEGSVRKEALMELVNTLIEKTTDFNQHSNAGYTALMVAIDLKETDIALKIIEKMDDFSQTNESGYTAISLAEKHQNFDIINAIKLKQGDYETTLLHLIENGKDAEAKKLVQEKDKSEAKMEFAFEHKDITKIESILTGNKTFAPMFNNLSNENAKEIANGLKALAASIEEKYDVQTSNNDNNRNLVQPGPALKKK